MNEIMEFLKDRKIDDKLEQALILFYNNNSLALHLVPHKYRNNGFFYKECLKKHRYDLIPKLSSETIKTFKKELLEKSSQLNRVDASAFNIKRVKADIHYLRAYLFQLMNEDFGLSISCRKDFESKNKIIEELSEIEIFELLGYEEDSLLNANGHLVKFNNNIENIEFYHFNDIDYNLDFTNYPELFTDIRQISFDQGGLVVFELYGNQIYKLFNSKGQYITGPCHDLDILINGKYIMRDSGNKPGFYMSKYCLHTDSVISLDSFSDFDSNVCEFLNLDSRDRLHIEIGNSLPKRIENFQTPNSRNEAKLILLADNCNWITSPELVKYYENDIELALLAVPREPLAYSLLSYELITNESIQKALCLSTKWNLLSYIKEWNLVIEKILTLDQLCVVIKNNNNVLSTLSANFLSKAECIMAAIGNDVSNMKFADNSLKKNTEFAIKVLQSHGDALEYFDESIKENKDIVLEAIKNNYYAIKYCSEILRKDPDFICEAYKLNDKIIRFIDVEIINQYQRIEDLNNKYKFREVEDLGDDLPF
jgi:hypothetical protein